MMITHLLTELILICLLSSPPEEGERIQCNWARLSVDLSVAHPSYWSDLHVHDRFTHDGDVHVPRSFAKIIWILIIRQFLLFGLYALVL